MIGYYLHILFVSMLLPWLHLGLMAMASGMFPNLFDAFGYCGVFMECARTGHPSQLCPLLLSIFFSIVIQ